MLTRTLLGLFLVLLTHGNKLYAEACQQVIATAHPDYPPYHWHENGKIVGASVDLHKQVFSEVGVELITRYGGPWKRVLRQAELGQVDMVMGLKKTQERESFLAFTTAPVFPNPFTIFMTRKKPLAFNSWHDLRGLQGGKNAGDRYGHQFDSFAEAHLALETANNPKQNFKKLLAGRIDYYVHSRFSGLAFLTTFSGKSQIKPAQYDINRGFIHSGFSKSSACKQHIPYLSMRYQELLDDGTAEKLLRVNLLRWQAFISTQNKHSSLP